MREIECVKPAGWKQLTCETVEDRGLATEDERENRGEEGVTDMHTYKPQVDKQTVSVRCYLQKLATAQSAS